MMKRALIASATVLAIAAGAAGAYAARRRMVHRPHSDEEFHDEAVEP